MTLTPFTDDINQYLKESDIINYSSPNISELSDKLMEKSADKNEYIENVLEFFKENIPHSNDIKKELITCIASDVLKERHGICFSKSHLFAALMRCKGIPTGLCYQKIILDDETKPVLVFHGLNGIYVEELKKWVRLDPGYKDSTIKFPEESEKTLYKLRSQKGEMDVWTVYPDPDPSILRKLLNNATRTQLWDNLPTEMEYRI
jgi:transglutaminase-like putative cysteine protease